MDGRNNYCGDELDDISELFESTVHALKRREANCVGSLAVRTIHHRLWKDPYCSDCPDRGECQRQIKAKLMASTPPLSCFGKCAPNRKCIYCEQYADCSLVSTVEAEGEACHREYLSGSSVHEPDSLLPSHTDTSDTVEVLEGVADSPAIAEGGSTKATVVEESEVPVEAAESTETEPRSAGYQFSHDDADFKAEITRLRGLSNTDLKAEMVRIDDVARSGVPYDSLRVRWCAISVALNERQIAPPVTRTKLFTSKGRKARSGSEQLASNDRQVVDLHWLHCGGCDALDAHHLITPAGAFDFESASEFVKTKGKADNKATMLGLNRKEMMLLSVIRSDSVKSSQQDIRGQAERRRMKIREALSQKNCRQTCSSRDMEAICDALLLADFDIEQAVLVLRQQYDITIGRQVMRRRRKWLQDQKVVSR